MKNTVNLPDENFSFCLSPKILRVVIEYIIIIWLPYTKNSVIL